MIHRPGIVTVSVSDSLCDATVASSCQLQLTASQHPQARHREGPPPPPIPYWGLKGKLHGSYNVPAMNFVTRYANLTL